MTEHPYHPEVEGLWLTITELAERAGLGKSAVSERVARLERSGHLKTRTGRGKSKLVNAAEYDRAIGQTADLGRARGARTRRLSDLEAPGGPIDSPNGELSYTREQARNVAYAADLKRLELDERRGALLRRDKVLEALGEAMSRIVHHLESITTWADEITEAVRRSETHGARTVLKTKVRELRTAMAGEFQRVAEAAPKFDPPLEDGTDP